MNEAAARARLLEQAGLLLALAGALSAHGVGDRWQGPARRECEAQLGELEATLRGLARRVNLVGHYAGVSDVRAHLS